MRIISGKSRGTKLHSLEGDTTRPTLDRVKESLFNIIQNEIQESFFLDLFSGSGAIGLEAASRGAKEVYLVDKSAVTFPLLKENVKNLKFDDFCFPLNKDSYDVLRDLAKKGKVMDVIFIDPPYCKEMIPEAMKIIEENKMLSEDGIIVTKIDSIEEIYEGYGSIKLYKSKKYGNTTVCYYKKN